MLDGINPIGESQIQMLYHEMTLVVLSNEEYANNAR